MDNHIINQISGKLYDACIGEYQIPVISSDFPDMDIEDAYRIQRSFTEKLLSSHGDICGYKIGGCSYNGAVGKFPLHYGMLPSALIYGLAEHIQTTGKIYMESEVAVMLNQNIEEASSVSEVIDSISAIAPSVELTRTRLQGDRTLADTICDNGAHNSLVLGSFIPVPADVHMQISINISIDGKHPDCVKNSVSVYQIAENILWLKFQLLKRGSSLGKSNVILGGTLNRPALCLLHNTQVRVDFSGIGDIYFDIF